MSALDVGIVCWYIYNFWSMSIGARPRSRISDTWVPILAFTKPVEFAFVFIDLSAWPHAMTLNPYLVASVIFVSIFTLLVLYARLYINYGIINTATKEKATSFIDGLYFSVITWTTVGYGDFVPDSRASRLFAAYQAFTGYFTIASILAVLVAYATNNHQEYLTHAVDEIRGHTGQ